MRSRRVLVTGLSTYWGGRLAEALEQDPDVEVVIGVDSEDPRVELERTEFIRVGTQHALIRRIVQAAEIDTVIDTRLVVDSSWTSPAKAHENNVIGTMNILTACTGEDSPVRKVVFKSSAHYYGCERDDPAFFTEEMERPHPPQTPIERDIVEAEGAVHEFSRRNPDLTVTVVRFANALGAGVKTSHNRLFALPAVPTILGFDPRYQFIHEDDIVGVLEFVVRNELPGVFNGAADGVLVLSEVVALLDKLMVPVLPPWGTGAVVRQLHRLGVHIPKEMLSQMRYGRGLDNRRLKAAGYAYRYTTREAVIKQREYQRVAPVLRGAREPYQYEREVEEFLRWSPNVRRRGAGAGKAWRPSSRQVHDLQRTLAALDEPGSPGTAAGDGPAGARAGAVEDSPPPLAPAAVEEYESLAVADLLRLLPSLPHADLDVLRRHEAEGRARPQVLAAIDGILAPGRSSAS
ncbi:MAG: NAD-dependent epimerase/dehydratase family protein [Actinomycetota bacterium]|nr:NAD-dependent epimerase/dehydratase family protein [Actinomycetota bacterium]